MSDAHQRCIKELVASLNRGIASLEARGVWYAQILRGERDAALAILAPSEPDFHEAILASMHEADRNPATPTSRLGAGRGENG